MRTERHVRLFKNGRNHRGDWGLPLNICFAVGFEPFHGAADRHTADAKVVSDYLHAVRTSPVRFGDRLVSVREIRCKVRQRFRTGIGGSFQRNTQSWHACVRRIAPSRNRSDFSAQAKDSGR